MIYNNLLATFLIKEGLLSEDEMGKHLTAANANFTPLFFELSKDENLDEETLYRALAKFSNLEFRTYELTEIDFDLISKFSREKMIEYRLIPYSEDEKTVYFACSNPLRIEDVKEFLSCGKNLVCFLITNTQMTAIINYIDNKIQQNDVLNDFSMEDKDISDATSGDVLIDAPIIKLCDSILKDAISRGASDIHIEPFQDIVRVRYRIDGKLTIIDTIKIHLFQSILARFKIMANLNIAERRVPQDGKINLEVGSVMYDFRVSTIPTINGEKLVIRIYNINLNSGDISRIGFNDKQYKLIVEMITRPHGIILLTGPTGSGKSTTLYTFLRYLNKEDTNIITVEDPVENQIFGINQVQVNAKANMTFASALRSILRQDPNVIMIGEIRDEETAQIATRAAITGHLVLSTIHTNDAAGVIARLINMGIPPYLVADSLLGAISQRLVRRLCNECKTSHVTNKSEMEMLHIDKPRKIYSACGCKRCNNTGYSGRLAVFEIMVCTDEVKNAIMSNKFTSDMLNEMLKESMPSILDNARERILSGDTTLDEYEKLSEVIAKA